MNSAIAEEHSSLALLQSDRSILPCHGDFATQHDDPLAVVNWATPDRGAAHADRRNWRADLHIRVSFSFNPTANV